MRRPTKKIQKKKQKKNHKVKRLPAKIAGSLLGLEIHRQIEYTGYKTI